MEEQTGSGVQNGPQGEDWLQMDDRVMLMRRLLNDDRAHLLKAVGPLQHW